jgi:SAM-dependent methyltransferase
VCGSTAVPFSPLPFYFFRELDKHQHVHSIFQYETLNLEHYLCSHCGASDRERLCALYLGEALRGCSGRDVLHIAPGAAFDQWLRARENLRVVTADLYMAGVDDTVDLTNMSRYVDAQFDVFLCSHVLEHIQDDLAALRELHRVLKPGGWGIVLSPIHLGLSETFEDTSVRDAGSRWRYFGQDDHVRIYAKADFVKRLQSAGFGVEELDRSHFGDQVLRKHGLHPRSVLYVVRKGVA